MSLNITLTQTIQSVSINSDGNITRTVDADSPAYEQIFWNPSFLFHNANGGIITCWPINKINTHNNRTTISDLNVQPQSTYSKNFNDCTITEARIIRHTVFGNIWKTQIKDNVYIEMTDTHVDSLIDTALNLCSV